MAKPQAEVCEALEEEVKRGRSTSSVRVATRQQAERLTGHRSTPQGNCTDTANKAATAVIFASPPYTLSGYEQRAAKSTVDNSERPHSCMNVDTCACESDEEPEG